MSHIPASAMPHATAHEDEAVDGLVAQPGQARSKPASTTAAPPTPASGTRPTDEPLSVDEGATVAPAPTHKPRSGGDENRSQLAVAAMVVGGLAVIGGLVAALLPILAAKDEPKPKKRRKRKAA